MSIDVNVQNDLVIVTESSEDITVNVSNAAGPAGVGVPVGGSTGQVLKKLSNTNYDTYWALDGGGVPYSGATGDVDLGEYELKAGQVEFDQTPTGTAGVGVMRWNDSDGTVDLGLKGGNVTLQIGQEQILRVVNKTGADLLENQYRAVRIRLAAEGGSQGQRLAVVLAQGNNDTNSTDTIGIVTENITDNQEGFICTSGIVRGINTTGSLQGETWADGDVIYLSPTTAGAITKVKPTAPNHSVVLGYVIYAHNVNGKIFVKCETGYEIGELHDCYLPTPSNNDGIFWNTTNLRYENNTIAGVLGFTPISGSGVSGQVAYWNGTGSQAGSNNLFWDAANSRLGIGTATPGVTLQVKGDAEFSKDVALFSGNNGPLQFIYTNPLGQQLRLGQVTAKTNATTINTFGLVLYSAQSSTITTTTGSTYTTPIGIYSQNTFGDVFINGFTSGVKIWGLDSAIDVNQTDIILGYSGSYNGISWGLTPRLNTSTGKIQLTGTTHGRITAAGRLLLGTTTESTYLLDVNGTARVSGGVLIQGLLELSTGGEALNLSGNSYMSINGAGSYFMGVTGSLFGTNGFNGQTVGFRTSGGFTFGIGTSTYHYLTNGNATFTDVTGLSASTNITSSAVLEARSTTKGFLPPRGTNTQMLAIASPATGLMFYDTTNNKLNCYDGTTWQACW